MTSQLSVEQSTQHTAARLWRNAWRRTHDMDRPPPRARTPSTPAGHMQVDASGRADRTSWLADMDVRVLSGAALLAVLVIGLAAAWLMPASCQSKPVPFVAGLTFNVAVAVPAGRACTISVEIGSVAVKSFQIEAPPAHGEVVARGRTGVVYLPQSGFKGDDTFAFSIEGSSEISTGKSVVRVNAAVR
jgi:hypothetical protein